jgi:hypothetical protein
VLTAGDNLVRRLNKREVGVVGHYSLGKRGELHAGIAEFVDLPHDPFDSALAAVKHRTQLYRRRLDSVHR